MPISERAAKAKLGDIVIVPFPYSEKLAEKRRPALVISNELVASRGYVWLAMITSARRGQETDDVRVEDFERAGLEKVSLVRPTKIACLEPSRIIRRAGSLSPSLAAKVFDTAKSFIGPRG